jgi:hypothetical protein
LETVKRIGLSLVERMAMTGHVITKQRISVIENGDIQVGIFCSPHQLPNQCKFLFWHDGTSVQNQAEVYVTALFGRTLYL